MNAKLLGLIAWILVMVGGINWLLIGLFKLNIVFEIFGESFLARLVYILVGLSACYLIYLRVQKKSVE